MGPHHFLSVLVAAGLAGLGAASPVRAGTNFLQWTFEDDVAGQTPAGWRIASPVGDFTAEIRQERGNKYLHLGSSTGEGTPNATATWGSGKPSSEWIYTGALLFRIRFNTVSPMPCFTLVGNVPASGPDNDHNTLLFVTYAPQGTTGMVIGVSGQPPIFTCATGQWHTVRIDFQGTTESVTTGDDKSHGTWKLSVAGQVATGEFGRVNNTFPFGCPVNGFRFGKWFRDPLDFDIDDVRIAGITRDPEDPADQQPRGPPPTGRGDDLIPRLKVEGMIYYEVRFGAVAGDRVVLFHSDGLANVPIAKLPPHYQTQLRPSTAGARLPQPSRQLAGTVAPDGPAEPETPAPPPGPSTSILGARGTVKTITGFVQTRIELAAFGGQGYGVLLEVARKRDSARDVPATMELRPGFWEGVDEYVLLTNGNPQWREGQLVRARVTEARPLKRYRVFTVTREY